MAGAVFSLRCYILEFHYRRRIHCGDQLVRLFHFTYPMGRVDKPDPWILADRLALDLGLFLSGVLHLERRDCGGHGHDTVGNRFEKAITQTRHEQT